MFKKNKKGTITLFIVFLITGVILITITAFVAPMMIKFNTKLYQEGEDIIRSSNSSIQAIQDDTARTRIEGITNGGLAASLFNIEANNMLFQYGWIFVLALTGLVIFLYTRRLVEYGGGIM